MTAEKPELTSLSAAAKDAVYIGVGLGILTFQKTQVKRRELTKDFDQQFGGPITRLDARIEELETSLDAVIGGIEAVLPPGVGGLVAHTHHIARSTRNFLRDKLLSAT